MGRWMWVIALAACGGPLEGRWTGDCELLDDTVVQTLEIDIYVADDAGEDFDGSADIEGHDATYILDGTRSDDAVGFTLHGTMKDGDPDNDPHWWVDFAGSIDDESDPPIMAGDATYWIEIYEDGEITGDSDPWEGTCSFEGLD